MDARRAVIASIRAAAVLMGIAAAVILASGVIQYAIEEARDGRVSLSLWKYRHELKWALPLLGAAAALWIFQFPLSHLIAPAPRHGICIECGYILRGSRQDRCPECGHSIRTRSQ